MTHPFNIKRWLGEHPDEEYFKHQVLDKNPTAVLTELGVSHGDVVLDFGCGGGTYTIPAARLVGERGRVYALDINRTQLDRTTNRAKQKGLTNIVGIAAAGGSEIPLAQESLDVILFIDVLHLIEEKDALFDEARRTLKRGGGVCVYPMHVSGDEVEALATRHDLTVEARRVQGRFLVFRNQA